MRTEGAGESAMGDVKIEAITAGLNEYIIYSSIYILPYLVSFGSQLGYGRKYICYDRII